MIVSMTEDEHKVVRNVLTNLQIAYSSLPVTALHHMYLVADYARTFEEYIVALCHDVVEDGLASYEDLETWGLTDEQIEAVFYLTRVANERYDEYIDTLCSSALFGFSGARLALNVKYYDLCDHLHPRHVEGLTDRRAERYLLAMADVVATARGIYERELQASKEEVSQQASTRDSSS